MTPAIVDARSIRKFAGLSFVAAALLVAAPRIASAQAKVSGAAISKVGHDTRKLTISAQSSAANTGTGTVQFIHNSPAGLTRFRGTVSCVSAAAGTVQVSG